MKKLSIVFVLLAACGGSSQKKTPENTITTTVAASAGVQLELGEMKLVDVSKNQTLTLQADGTIVIPPQPDGDRGMTLKVTSDGKILAGDKVGFQLMPDGSIHGSDGKALDVSLSADAVITSGDKKISLDPAGALIGTNPNAPQLRVEGATTVGLKRTALFVTIALTSGEPRPVPAS